ncbi:MAG: adenylate/guanylate cyclase domain-containing protein, partial [Terriglobales bacterium]
MARLLISSPSGASGILELAKAVVTIGRGSANDLVLDDESVSRFHAVLKQETDGEVLVADRGSTNGVVVNGARISTETALRHGDQVKVGIYELKFESTDIATLVIRKAEIPSTLRDVLEGKGSELGSRAMETPTGTFAEMVERIKQLERDKYLLTVLYDAGKALNSTLSLDGLAEQVMLLAFRIEGVERGFMMFFDPAGEVSRQTEVRYRSGTRRATTRKARGKRPRRPPDEQPRIILSRSILERIRQERAPILIADASADQRFQGSESVKISGLRSAMCAPLLESGAESGRLLGLLYVDNLEKEAAFSEEELSVFALVAAQAASALASAVARQQLAEHALHRSALERFLSPEVVEMIAADPNVRLGGVNQKVSVLFCDIRGFTSISEQLKPEKVVEILNEFFTRITDVVFDHGGTLDKYLGDGLLAVFGAPISKGKDAANAVGAAIAIQKLVLELNRDSAARRWPELKVGIGVSTGIVTAGNIGSPRRLDYTVVGDTVNVASRLVSHAAGGQILITEATAADLGPGFDCAPMPPLLV